MGRVIIIDHNLDYFERISDQIGNYKGVLREVAEMFICSLFGCRELNIKYQSIRSAMADEFAVTPERPEHHCSTHTMSQARFPAHKEECVLVPTPFKIRNQQDEEVSNNFDLGALSVKR